MALIRLAVLVLVVYVVFTAVRSFVRGKARAAGKLRSTSHGEDMVLDPQCQSYVPKSEAVSQSGRYFCSRECARRYLNS